MYNKPEQPQASDAEGDEESDADVDPDEMEARTREEAAANWMVEQGFDRKE
jgi:hypothetical protein